MPGAAGAWTEVPLQRGGDEVTVARPAEAPALRGTAEHLLQAALERQGVEQVVRPVRVRELQAFTGAFACNASGIQPIAGIDETLFAIGHDWMARLRAAAALAPWEAL